MGKSWEMTRDVTLPGGRPVIGPYVGKIIETLHLRLIPDGGRINVRTADTGSYEFLARYLRDQEAGGRLGIIALLILFDLAPFLFIQRFCRFVNLSPQEQEFYLTDWGVSRLYHRRMVLMLLKTIIGMGYYNDPKVLSEIGFKLKCEEGNRS
jgi:hypothetical protein